MFKANLPRNQQNEQQTNQIPLGHPLDLIFPQKQRRPGRAVHFPWKAVLVRRRMSGYDIPSLEHGPKATLMALAR